MKISKIIMLTAILFIGIQTSAQEVSYVKETFKVWGKCDMCKSKIEKTVNEIDGVKSAKWSLASQKILIKFNDKATSLDEIQSIIAGAGYDNEKYKAKDEAYNNLHHCCKYDRK